VRSESTVTAATDGAVPTPAPDSAARLQQALGTFITRTDAPQRVIHPIAQDRQRGDRVHATASIVGQAITFTATAAVALAAAQREIDLTALATYLSAVAGVAAINH
jgi:hypothetical protein